MVGHAPFEQAQTFRIAKGMAGTDENRSPQRIISEQVKLPVKDTFTK